MQWSISEVSDMTGLSSRALRHYHAIGLLEPCSTAEGGRRYYGPAELQRLQQILLLRDLGLPLGAIAETLDGGGADDTISRLRRHVAHLEAERARYDRLIATVQRTIRKMEEGTPMTPHEMFDGLIHNPYEDEARATWGDDAVDASNERLRRLSAEDRALLTSARGFEEVPRRLAPLKNEGLPIDDPRVQEVVAYLHRLVSLAWTPNREGFIGLGAMYVQDPRFTGTMGGGDESLVLYLKDAMEVYALAELAE